MVESHWTRSAQGYVTGRFSSLDFLIGVPCVPRLCMMSSFCSDAPFDSAGERSNKRTYTRWSHEDNLNLMYCHLQSKPGTPGCWERMRRLWSDLGYPDKTGGQLSSQVRSIRRSGLLSDIELMEIRCTIAAITTAAEVATTHASQPTGSLPRVFDTTLGSSSQPVTVVVGRT